VNGHIRQRSPGSFELRYRVGGAVRTETIRTASKKAAAARLRELLVAVDRNEHVTPSRMTLATWMAERISMWQLSPRTREHYQELANLITRHLGDRPLQKLTTLDIERWHVSAGVAPSTLRHAHWLLVRVLSAAKRHQLISGNPALEQPPPRAPTRKVKVPTEDQIAPMLDSLVGTEFHVPVVLTINTALRRSELLALRWSDINLDAATLTVARALDETRAGGVTFKSTKTESGLRTISLPAAAVVALRQHRKAQLERCLLLGLGRPASDSRAPIRA
jgi:integrase